MSDARWISWCWTLGLALLALIHLAPVLGVAGADALQKLYGIGAEGPDLQLLLRHRAVLFGMAGGIMLLALFHPCYRGIALAVGWLNVISFIVLAAQTGQINEALTRVLWVDYFALLPLTGLSALLLFGPRQ